MSEVSETTQNNKLRLNNNTLTKEEQRYLLTKILPKCQPQEGTPQNTFTQSELEDLKKASIEIVPNVMTVKRMPDNNKINICSLADWMAPPQDGGEEAPPQDGGEEAPPQDGGEEASPQDGSGPEVLEKEWKEKSEEEPIVDWHDSPRFHKDAYIAREFRDLVRRGEFIGPTNGSCPGFLQCNLVVLPQGQFAFDFLLFCQRNPKACPLIEVCDVGSPFPTGVALGADLRTDVPKYAIYRDGKLDKEVTDVTEYWPEQSVAFLIGCSFSYDGALMDAGIKLKSFEEGKNVPMYKTSMKCRPAGSLKGNMVVSMKPISALKVSKHIEITSKYTHAHGGPVSVGSGIAIGVEDMDKPEWGEQIDVAPDEVPIFHACGVTPQSILMESKVPFAITHSAGHMFVTDLPSDLGI